MTAIAVYDELRKADKHSKWFLILEVTMKLQIILEPSEEGGYTVTVPALPGCISEGDSLDEAVANIQGWLDERNPNIFVQTIFPLYVTSKLRKYR